MRRNILIALANFIVEHRAVDKLMRLPTTPNKQKRTSNKSKLKQTKSKPHAKYKSSKPMQSKSVKQFRNNSNI